MYLKFVITNGRIQIIYNYTFFYSLLIVKLSMYFIVFYCILLYFITKSLRII